jgi:phospholipase/carboxylesterase
MTNSLSLDAHRRAPASGGAAKRLVVLLHGLGADGADLIELAPLLAGAFPDAEFLAPNAPFPCDMAPMGRQWFSLRAMTMDDMLKGAREAEPILDAFLDESLEAHGLGERDLAVIGFSQPPVLLVHGTADEVVPFQAMDAAKEALKAAGVPVEASRRPGLGHGIDPEGITLAVRHLQQAFAAD